MFLVLVSFLGFLIKIYILFCIENLKPKNLKKMYKNYDDFIFILTKVINRVEIGNCCLFKTVISIFKSLSLLY